MSFGFFANNRIFLLVAQTETMDCWIMCCAPRGGCSTAKDTGKFIAVKISMVEDKKPHIAIFISNQIAKHYGIGRVDKSRGAYLMGLTTYGKYEIEDQVNFAVYVPKIDEHFVGSLAVVPLQLMGYYVSVAKGLDVDKPRNLAKSVTVE